MSNGARRQSLFVGVFLVVVLLFVTTFRMGIVRGESMLPTYVDGQVVLVRRRNWFSSPFRRGDVVLLSRDRDVLIKRIVCLPGDELTDEGALRAVRLHGTVYDLTDYFEQKPGETPDTPRLFVPKGYLFVMGDNRRASEDSRAFGPIPIHDVLGVVVAAPPPPPIPSDRPPDWDQSGSPSFDDAASTRRYDSTSGRFPAAGRQKAMVSGQSPQSDPEQAKAR